jgi:hypothetical protein
MERTTDRTICPLHNENSMILCTCSIFALLSAVVFFCFRNTFS